MGGWVGEWMFVFLLMGVAALGMLVEANSSYL